MLYQPHPRVSVLPSVFLGETELKGFPTSGMGMGFSRWGLVSKTESKPIEGITGPPPTSYSERDAEHGDRRLFRQHQGQLSIGREPQA